MQPAQPTLVCMQTRTPVKVNRQSRFLLLILIFTIKLECAYGYHYVRIHTHCEFGLTLFTRTHRTFAWIATQSDISFLRAMSAHNATRGVPVAQGLAAISVLLVFKALTTCNHLQTRIHVPQAVLMDTKQMRLWLLASNAHPHKSGTMKNA